MSYLVERLNDVQIINPDNSAMTKIFITRLLAGIVILLVTAKTLFAGSLNVLVNPFEFRGDRSFSWLSAGFTDTVISDFKNAKGMAVFSEEEQGVFFAPLKKCRIFYAA